MKNIIKIYFLVLFLGFIVNGIIFAAEKNNPAKTKVKDIVFVELKESCKCIRETTQKTWTALQEALKEKKLDIPIKKLLDDEEEDKVAPYEKMKAIVVIPAVYLLDDQGKLIEMLQGEVEKDQFIKLF